MQKPSQDGKQFQVRKTAIKASPQIQNNTKTLNSNPIKQQQQMTQSTINRTSLLKQQTITSQNTNGDGFQGQLMIQLKNAESQILNLQDQVATLSQRAQIQDEKMKNANTLLNNYERKIRDQTEEIHHWISKLKDIENINKKIREKKKNYKKKVNELQNKINQLEENQNTNQQILQNPFQQIIELRQMLMSLRLQQQLIPLLQSQFRTRIYQTQDLDVSNMSYEQLLELEQNIGNHEVGLAREDIKRIRKRMVQSNEELDMCTICQCNLTTGEKYRKLSCNHCYHSGCIKSWLLRHRNCPLCKADVRVPS